MYDKLRGTWRILFIFVLLAGVMLFGREAVLASSGAENSSLHPDQQDDLGIDVNMWIAPGAAQPGEMVTLNIVLMSTGSQPTAPELIINFPSIISPILDQLPPGTVYNNQLGILGWQPVIGNSNPEVTLSLDFSVEVADIRQPTQTITANIRQGTVERNIAADFWIGVAPQASIVADPPQVAVGQRINLSAKITGPGPFTQKWTLGDGRTVEAIDPEIVYPSPGTYVVTLHVSNAVGIFETASLVTVATLPVAKFNLDDSTPAVNQPVQFSNESGGQSPLQIFWDFGDGATSLEVNPVHRFATPGIYQVRLTIQNELGQSETLTKLSVGQTSVVDLIIDPIGRSGQLVSGQAFGDASVTNYKWNMGDGETYDGEFVNHVYWAPGDYQITVTASNEFGDSQASSWIHIDNGLLSVFLPTIFQTGLSTTDEVQLAPANEQSKLLETTEESLTPIEFSTTLTPAEKLLAYINKARQVNGLNQVNQVHELSIAAQQHVYDMAVNSHESHTGSDGSVPALRIQRSGYNGGYGGEATAWGMQDAIDPVNYWLNSPGHRLILLNPAVTDVGIGFVEDYSSPNVWYWTAEFASLNLPVVVIADPQAVLESSPTPVPVIQLLGPPQNSEFSLSANNDLIFTWNWSNPLEPDQFFGLYLKSSSRTFQLGVVRESQAASQYQFKTSAAAVPVTPGEYTWQLLLEDSSGNVMEESVIWPVVFISQQVNPATAEPQATSTAPIATPTPLAP